MDERMEAIVSGRVQLVMFRDFACRKARGLGLVGEVQNLPNGTVRVVAEGKRVTLEQFIAHLHRGPLLAHVTDVQTRFLPATGIHTSFVLRYD